MTQSIRRLAQQTAIYGLSSIFGRLLNYLLVPLYTNYFLSHEYGVITEMYSYVAILIVILTHGMETAYFRFNQQETVHRDKVFGTSLFSVTGLAMVFVAGAIIFSGDIAGLMRYPDNHEYVIWLGIIIGLDAFMAVPFARLRAENRPIMFAVLKLAGILVNIILVLFFIVVCPWILEKEITFMHGFVNHIYDPSVGVGYVFIANLFASSFTALLLLPIVFRARISFSIQLWKEMIIYSLPLLVAGLAGIINEALDKPLLKYLLPEDIAMSQVGIYGATYKLSVFMILFIQAFRFAAEPFFFAEFKSINAKILYARVMKIFVVTCLFIFLGIMLYMDILQYFIGPDFREGLSIVPVLLIAHIFLGIYFNLSIWYKLTGQTHFGAWIAVFGALITIVFNVALIPTLGYVASAWAHLVCYFSMTLLSWLLGRKYYHVPYDIPSIFFYMAVALSLFGVSSLLPDMPRVLNWLISALLLLVFAVVVILTDRETREMLLRFYRKLVIDR